MQTPFPESSDHFSHFDLPLGGTTGGQKGVNWAQNEDFSHFMTVSNNLSGCTRKNVNANLE